MKSVGVPVLRYACLMCGRFLQTISWRELHELAGLIGAPVELAPRYNLAPGQDAAVIRAGAEGPRLESLRWGLIPSWAKDPAIGNKLINARVETAAEKPSFRSSWRSRRCLIPATGYYEWNNAGNVRQPWLIRRRHRAPLFLAGLWERWRVTESAAHSGRFAGREAGEQIETFVIITTSANDDVAAVHYRMPVLVHPEQFDSWLTNPSGAPAAAQPGYLTAEAVSTRVNDPRNDDSDCLLPLP